MTQRWNIRLSSSVSAKHFFSDNPISTSLALSPRSTHRSQFGGYYSPDVLITVVINILINVPITLDTVSFFPRRTMYLSLFLMRLKTEIDRSEWMWGTSKFCEWISRIANSRNRRTGTWGNRPYKSLRWKSRRFSLSGSELAFSDGGRKARSATDGRMSRRANIQPSSWSPPQGNSNYPAAEPLTTCSSASVGGDGGGRRGAGGQGQRRRSTGTPPIHMQMRKLPRPAGIVRPSELQCPRAWLTTRISGKL